MRRERVCYSLRFTLYDLRFTVYALRFTISRITVLKSCDMILEGKTAEGRMKDDDNERKAAEDSEEGFGGYD